MGGHGGLNILPQKKWNVYNWDNRIKVRKDEKRMKEEMNKEEKLRKHKRFNDRIRGLKAGNTDIELKEATEEKLDQNSMNRLYKDLRAKESEEKRMKTDKFFYEMNRVIKPGEHVNLFSCEENQDKERVKAEKLKDEFTEKTIKETIKADLTPWYGKKAKSDYAFLEEVKTDSKNEENKSGLKIYDLQGNLLLNTKYHKQDLGIEEEERQGVENKEKNKEEEVKLLEKKRKHKKEKKEKKEKKKKEKKKKHKKDSTKLRRSSSRSSSSSQSRRSTSHKKQVGEITQSVSIQKLRRERLEREEEERKRIQDLLATKKHL